MHESLKNKDFVGSPAKTLRAKSISFLILN